MSNKFTFFEAALYLPHQLLVETKEGRLKVMSCTGKGSVHVSVQDVVSDPDIKPLLHPLSRITKKIKRGPKEFVPAMVLWPIGVKEEKEFDLYGELPEHWKMCLAKLEVSTDHLEFCTIQKLISWNFDVFNLIPKGEAKTKKQNQ